MIEKNEILLKKCEDDSGFYYKTDGLSKRGYMEIAISMPIDEELAKNIINVFVDYINKNKKLESGPYKNILTCPVYLNERDEVLSLVFPDTYIRFPWEEKCEAEYKKQLW